MAGRPPLFPHPSIEEVLEAVVFIDGPCKVGQVWRVLLTREGAEEVSRHGTGLRLRELVERGNLERHGRNNGTRYYLVSSVLDAPTPEETKRCAGCRQDKPISAFSPRGDGKHRSRCRGCERIAERVDTGHYCEVDGCGEAVLVPGKCGFCREEAGERLLDDPAPSPLTAAVNRAEIAVRRAGRSVQDHAANLSVAS